MIHSAHNLPNSTKFKLAGLLVTKKFEELLSQKHLYQRVRIERELAANLGNEENSFDGSAVNAISSYFKKKFECEFSKRNDVVLSEADLDAPSRLFFPPPSTIWTACETCGKQPFNPLVDLCHQDSQGGLANSQWFYFAYQCQACKKNTVRFIVRREKDQLIICGRDPFEKIEISKVIPSIPASDHYRNALIARNGGQILAGIFLLRTFIEQFWLSIPEVSQARCIGIRASGDELGTAYKSTLHPTLNADFPSLSEVYSDTSAAIHQAVSDEEIFEKARSDIEKHFEAKALFDSVAKRVVAPL